MCVCQDIPMRGTHILTCVICGYSQRDIWVIILHLLQICSFTMKQFIIEGYSKYYTIWKCLNILHPGTYFALWYIFCSLVHILVFRILGYFRLKSQAKKLIKIIKILNYIKFSCVKHVSIYIFIQRTKTILVWRYQQYMQYYNSFKHKGF